MEPVIRSGCVQRRRLVRVAVLIFVALLTMACSSDASSDAGLEQNGDLSGSVYDPTVDGEPAAPRRSFTRREPGSVIDSAGLTRFESCQDMEAYLQQETAATVTAFGYGADVDYGQFGDVTHRTKKSTYRSGSRPNWINPFWYVPDQVVFTSITGGDRMVIVYGDSIRVVDVSGRSPVIVAKLRLEIGYPEAILQDLLLLDDRLLLIFQGGATSLPLDTAAPDIDRFAGSVNRADLRWTTVIAEIGLGDPEPRATRYLRLRGQFVDTEISEDGKLRLVTGYEQRRLPGETHPGDNYGMSAQESLQHNRELAAATPLESWMPEYRLTDGDGAVVASGMLGDCSRAYRLGEFAGPGVLSIVTLDMADAGMEPPSDVVSVMASAASVTSSPGSVFVTTSPYRYELGATDVRRVQTDDPHGDVHRYEFSEQGSPQYSASVGIAGWVGGARGARVVGDTLRLPYFWFDHPDDSHDGNEGLLVFDIADGDLKLKQRGEVLAGSSALTSVAHTSKAAVWTELRGAGEDDHAHVVDVSNPSGEVNVSKIIAIPSAWDGFTEIGDDLLLYVGDKSGPAVEVHKRTVLLLDVSNPASPRIAGQAADGFAIGHHWSAHPTDEGAVTVVPLEPCDRDNCTVAVITATADGLAQRGTVAHRNFVITSELVGDILYTITPTDMIATDLTTMEETGRLTWRTE